MTQLLPRRWLALGITLGTLLLGAACQPQPVAATPAATQGGNPPAATPTVEPEAVATATLATGGLVFGPGPFNLPAPTVGLEALSSYRETLTITFEGTQAGQPAQWSRTYVMVASTPEARQVTVDTAGEAAAQVYVAEVNGAVYERQGEAACTVAALEDGASISDQWEPARFMSGVIGAEEAGAETVNGVAANHYTFDASALGAAEVAESTGELWVAADGGYLVKYVLTTTGSAPYFGEGTEGTATWDYQLTDINQPLAVELPADCPAGMLDVPLLPDATDVFRQPGLTHYTTVTGLAEAEAFYQEQLPGLGWQPVGEPVLDETTGLVEFTRAEQQMSVILAAGDGVTTVTIVVGVVEQP